MDVSSSASTDSEFWPIHHPFPRGVAGRFERAWNQLVPRSPRLEISHGSEDNHNDSTWIEKCENCLPVVNPSLSTFNVADTQRFDYVPESRLFPRFQNPP